MAKVSQMPTNTNMVRTLTGEDYTFFKDARHTFRVKRVNGVICNETIEKVSSHLNISLDEATAILAGQIPTMLDLDRQQFSWDRADFAKLFAQSPEPSGDVVDSDTGFTEVPTGVDTAGSISQNASPTGE